MARVSQSRVPHVVPPPLARIPTGISGLGGTNIRMHSRASKFYNRTTRDAICSGWFLLTFKR